jgi:hypothetical protein
MMLFIFSPLLVLFSAPDFFAQCLIAPYYFFSRSHSVICARLGMRQIGIGFRLLGQAHRDNFIPGTSVGPAQLVMRGVEIGRSGFRCAGCPRLFDRFPAGGKLIVQRLIAGAPS